LASDHDVVRDEHTVDSILQHAVREEGPRDRGFWDFEDSEQRR
jgi:hypothetical protein